jgi:hypothetical protein
MNGVLAKIVLHECEQLSEAEILFRNCPQDNLAGHADLISQNIKEGKTKLFKVVKEGREIGFVAVEIYNSEFIVVAMHTNEHCSVFDNVLPMFIETAKQRGCRCVTFSTIRHGLIKQAIKSGFILSEIVMRKHL